MKRIISAVSLALLCGWGAFAQTARPLTEDDYYRMITLPVPEGIALEVGGMAVLPDGRLSVCTRRGDVWMISNPYMEGSRQPQYKRFAKGLHEPLGLAYHNGVVYATQRGEMTRLLDTDNNGVADQYESVVKWPLSGNYHEYSYGPLFLPNGEMLVTLNLGWIGHGASLAKWRGWMLKVNDKGEIKPYATGLRSPAGFAQLRDGSIFYAENQGDWVGSGRMTQLNLGDFAGNPEGLRWTSEPDSPLKLKQSDVPSTGKPMYEMAKSIPNLKVPAIWFPHTLMGISTSDILEDTTSRFGPFPGQLFVGDQGHSKVMRVFLEKVNGEYQGACFPFRNGFMSGILRMAWGVDGSMFVGMTSRGWAATGKEPFGVQRLVWTGKTPFEMKAIRSMPDGFEVEFTMPVDKKTAASAESYSVSSFTYKYHSTYGSPIENARELPIRGVVVSNDGLKARIVVDTTLQQGYIHELKAEGVKSANGLALLHNFGYYTLNNIASGEKLAIAAPAKHTAHHDMTAMASTKPTAGSGTKTIRPSAATTAANAAKRMTEQPADWTNGPDQVVTISTLPGLKFEQTQVQVKAGSRIKWVFNNNDDMLHNCVIVKPGTANPVGEAALRLNLNGPKMQYVPNSPNVLFYTNLLQPEAAESIYFVAPTTPGDYTYVCTFPGHYTVMQGILKVVK